MKGNNVLLLNEATMIEALQHWLESQFIGDKAPEVIGIVQHPIQNQNDTKNFEVSVKSKEATS